MKSRTLQIALQIMLIKEQFTENEIFEAVKFLEDQGSSSSLLEYLSGKSVKAERPKRNKSKGLVTDERHSRAVMALVDKDPEKFKILSEFESLMRKKIVLTELNDIRKLAERLSKTFPPIKSREEAISKLINYIVQLPIEDIQRLISEEIASKQINSGDSEFQQLAKFIITGKST
jgi:hypothetical protein